MSRADGRRHWTQRPRPDLPRASTIDRYVQNHVVGTIAVEGEWSGRVEVGFDGFSECWFKDETQFLRAVRVADVGEGRRGRLQRLRHDEPLGCEAGGADHQGLTLKAARRSGVKEVLTGTGL